MRHYMVDPDNEERLLKIPPHVVSRIKWEERQRIRRIVNQYWIEWTADDRCIDDLPCQDCTIFILTLKRIDGQ